jgi:meso-butanediol dehydrogenase/(S,S)-butanediol dehydrogenase/diacetyl reductase
MAERSALITGAARGIGRAIAGRLIRDGLAVTVADLPGAQLDACAAELGALGVPVDVVDPEAVDAAVAAHVAEHGGLDVLVANAGIAVTAPLLETTADDLQRILDVNLKGVFHCYQAAARQMIAQGRGGRLIGAASVAAHRGGNGRGRIRRPSSRCAG